MSRLSLSSLPTATTGYYHVRHLHLYGGPAPLPQAFVERLSTALARHRVPLVAYSIIADGWQVVAGPVGKARLLRTLRWVDPTRLASSTAAWRVLAIHDVADLVPLVRYVERAARSAGHVDRAEAWPWCSLAQRLTRTARPGLVDARFLASPTWVTYVNAALTDAERLGDAARRHPAAS